MSSSVASMKKWGIPPSSKKNAAPEITLLERLVWVRYQGHWWPALLYHSYSELQQHLYDQLDMVLKAQFAMAIMRHMQDKHELKIARLLGRPILEVIEVEEDCYCEFYWQLPNVLPKACKRSRYGDNLELYFDFHRALDQVEDIIRDVSEENFALMPHNDHLSWLERAEMALNEENKEETASIRHPSVIQLENYDGHHPSPPSVHYDHGIPRTDSSADNPIVVDDLPHIHMANRAPGLGYSHSRARANLHSGPKANHEARRRAGDQEHEHAREEQSSIWDSMMKSISHSYGDDSMVNPDAGRIEVTVVDPIPKTPLNDASSLDPQEGSASPKEVNSRLKKRDPNGTRERVDRSDPAGSAIDSRSLGPVRDVEVALVEEMPPSSVQPQEESRDATPTSTKTGMLVSKGESLTKNEASEPEVTTTKKKTTTRKSRVSTSVKKKGGRKSAVSKESSSSETSAKLNALPTRKKTTATETKVRKKPSPEKRAYSPKKASPAPEAQPVEQDQPEVVDETRDPPSESTKAMERKQETAIVPVNQSVQVLPGLEGDDIMPGLSEKKDEVSALPVEGTPVEHTELALERPQLSLWQRMTNCA